MSHNSTYNPTRFLMEESYFAIMFFVTCFLLAKYCRGYAADIDNSDLCFSLQMLKQPRGDSNRSNLNVRVKVEIKNSIN